MYTFSQLLIRNILLGVVFVASAAGLSLFFLNEYIAEKQSFHKQSISTFVTTFHDSPKNLAAVLKQASDYNELMIRQLDSNEVLYSYVNKNQQTLFNLVQPPKQSFQQGSVNIKVEFQLSVDKEVNLLLTILAILTTIIFTLVILATFMSKRHSEKFFAAIKEQIKIDLSLIKAPEKDSDSENIIDIPELKQAVEEIKQLIESQVANSSVLEKEAYTDLLTELGNRNKFVQYYENNIAQQSSVEFGVLVITRCSELQTVNQIHGYHEGDNYIKQVAQILTRNATTYKSAQLYRLNSSDFAVILPNTMVKEAEQFAEDLRCRFNEYQQTTELDSVAYTGMVYFDDSKPLGEILALADTGISIAQTQRINAWYVQKESDSLKNNAVNQGNQNWRQEIENVIDNQRISLLVQPIQPTTRNSKVYHEVLARFLNSNDEMLPTASFIAMSEKLDKIANVDKLIVESAIREIASKNLVNQSFGINISPRSITDEQFLIWLERRLLREPDIAPRLVFEISEYGLQQNIKTSKRFIDMIHRSGSRVCVERFGVGLTSFKFFRDLKPDFIKMDSTYTRDIDEDKNNQYFLRLMVDLAHRLSIGVLAESVESQEEKHALEKLFIDGCQGFFIGKPKPI